MFVYGWSNTYITSVNNAVLQIQFSNNTYLSQEIH